LIAAAPRAAREPAIILVEVVEEVEVTGFQSGVSLRLSAMRKTRALASLPAPSTCRVSKCWFFIFLPQPKEIVIRKPLRASVCFQYGRTTTSNTYPTNRLLSHHGSPMHVHRSFHYPHQYLRLPGYRAQSHLFRKDLSSRILYYMVRSMIGSDGVIYS
jgi:hypothetical protein